MIFTKEQLELLSDWQVSGAVAEKLGHKVRHWKYSEIFPIVLLYPSQASGDFWEFHGLSDEVTMSLIKKFKISLLETVGGWSAIKNNVTGVSVYSNNKDANRAVAECFLLMEVAE